jgi:hypothetical protein
MAFMATLSSDVFAQMGIRDHPISARSPWQNGYAEADRLDPKGVSRPHRCLRRATSSTSAQFHIENTTTRRAPTSRYPRTRHRVRSWRTAALAPSRSSADCITSTFGSEFLTRHLRERRGLRRFTIGVSEGDLRVIAEHGYEGPASTDQDQQAQAVSLFITDMLEAFSIAAPRFVVSCHLAVPPLSSASDQSGRRVLVIGRCGTAPDQCPNGSNPARHACAKPKLFNCGEFFPGHED